MRFSYKKKENDARKSYNYIRGCKYENRSIRQKL